MRKRVFLIMIGILASLAVFVRTSFAQDIDISNMDNAQLMSLVQAILQKLEERQMKLRKRQLLKQCLR